MVAAAWLAVAGAAYAPSLAYTPRNVDPAANRPADRVSVPVLLVPGWLLTFLLAVLQRIVPFLGSVHASTAAGGTPLISALTPGPLLGLHGALHLAALGALVAGAITGRPFLVHAGAAAGLAAALVFAAFFVFVVARIRHGIQPPHQPAPA